MTLLPAVPPQNMLALYKLLPCLVSLEQCGAAVRRNVISCLIRSPPRPLPLPLSPLLVSH